MATRLTCSGVVLAMLIIISGCQTRSANYGPACCGPKVVATAPAPACPTPCPTPYGAPAVVPVPVVPR